MNFYHFHIARMQCFARCKFFGIHIAFSVHTDLSRCTSQTILSSAYAACRRPQGTGIGNVIGFPLMPAWLCNLRRMPIEVCFTTLKYVTVGIDGSIIGSPCPVHASQDQNFMCRRPLAALSANINCLRSVQWRLYCDHSRPQAIESAACCALSTQTMMKRLVFLLLLRKYTAHKELLPQAASETRRLLFRKLSVNTNHNQASGTPARGCNPRSRRFARRLGSTLRLPRTRP